MLNFWPKVLIFYSYVSEFLLNMRIKKYKFLDIKINQQILLDQSNKMLPLQEKQVINVDAHSIHISKEQKRTDDVIGSKERRKKKWKKKKLLKQFMVINQSKRWFRF